MNRIILSALVGVLASGPATVYAFTSGNDVYESCNEDKYYCMEYAAAWASGYYAGYNLAGWPLEYICLPNEIINRQLGDTLFRYLEQHPETRHLKISDLAFKALDEAFPCKK